MDTWDIERIRTKEFSGQEERWMDPGPKCDCRKEDE